MGAKGVPFWNATARIEKEAELNEPAIVKCVVSSDKICMPRNFKYLHLQNPFEPVRKILGVLGYRKESLLQFNRLPRTPLESTQSIDQLRIIGNDNPLMSGQYGYPGINDMREEKIIQEIYEKDEIQNGLDKILQE